MPLSDDQIDQVLETLENATEENHVSSARQGQVVNLPAEGEIWVTGDLHDHRRNFEKFVIAADLANHPHRHVVLHEVIHGEHFDENRAEDSWQMLFWAADLKCAFSSQVHFLFANHDLAQIHGEGIMKAGLSVCEAFNAGVKRDFGSRRAAAHVAITEMLLSFPLAIRTGNGLFLSHSLPTEDQIPGFDYGVFDRALTGEDYRRRTGAVYQLVWGRKMSPQAAGAFADRVGARILITGHQPQESGFAVNGDRHIIIASDHNQGVFLQLSLSETYDMSRVVERVRRFISLSLPDQAAPAESSEFAEMEPPSYEPTEQATAAPEDEITPPPVEPLAVPDLPAPDPFPPSDTPPESSNGMQFRPFPSQRQREAIWAMIADGLGEIQSLCQQGSAAQAAHLAETFQNVARQIQSPETWDSAAIHQTLSDYLSRWRTNGQPDPDYTARLDQIMTQDAAVAS